MHPTAPALSEAADHQFQYVEGQSRPGFADLLAQYQAESDAVAASPGAALDLPYGEHPRQRFDFFPAVGAAQGVMLYLHAGYWQSRDKSLFRFLAPAFQARGWHVALANYPLCPDVTLDALVQAVAPGVAAVAQHVRQRGDANLPLVVAGHSAGAHLASWLGLAHGALPADDPARVAGVWAISGIYDLAPLVDTTLNQRLRLDPASARRLSPLLHAAAPCVPAVWLVGGAETPAFLAQNSHMHQHWQGDTSAPGAWSEAVAMPGADHFTVLRDWAALRGPLAGVHERWWGQVLHQHRLGH
jgi:arylformamidase